MDKQIKPRKPAGPKPTLKDRRSINVSLTDDLIERAREIGRGNISAGVRMSLEVYRDTSYYGSSS